MSDFNSQTGFTPPNPAHLADLFPGFQISRLIACGGMGAVYEAVQISLDRAVAIKILPREFTSDDAFRTGFEAEAKTMARLNHPNLIGVYDFGEVDGMLYIIMEYVPGMSMYQAAGGQPIIAEEVVPLISAIARGLAHAHDSGIIHRDIKPANILLNHHNEPKIGDFGLARPLESQIQDGEDIFGTPGYTAPEVVEHPQSIDHRADIFSLGVLLHELLTGKLPEADPRPASAICQCDPRFDAIIHKATRRSPAERYDNANDIARELEKIPTTAGPRALRTASPGPRSAHLAAHRAAPHAALAGHHPPHAYTRPVATPSSSKGIWIIILVFAIAIIGFLIIQKNKKPAVTDNPPVEEPTATIHNPTIPTIPTIPTTPENKPPPIEDPAPIKDPPPAIEGVAHWGDARSTWDQSGDGSQCFMNSGHIGGATDSGTFKHDPWTGDGLFTTQLASLFGGSTEAMAGLMLREGLEADARHIFLACNRNGETVLLFRPTRGGETAEYVRIPSSLRIHRIERRGDRLVALASNDGDSWTEMGSILINDLADEIYVGHAAASATGSDGPPLDSTFGPIKSTAIDTTLTIEGAPAPRINMKELFRRARAVMKQQAVPLQEELRQRLMENRDAFMQQANAIVERHEAAASHHAAIVNSSGTDPRIAPALPPALAALDAYAEVHQIHLAKQRLIELDYAQAIAGIAEDYLNGIDQQLVRSRADDDTGAIEILEAEKQRTKHLPYHFRHLMEHEW